MTTLEIQQAITYMQNRPAAVKSQNAKVNGGNVTDKIIKVLNWALVFVNFYNTAFRTKDGEYRMSGILKAWSIAKAVFNLGKDLIIKK